MTAPCSLLENAMQDLRRKPDGSAASARERPLAA
jgi:hypothetical protein